MPRASGFALPLASTPLASEPEWVPRQDMEVTASGNSKYSISKKSTVIG